MGFVAQLGTVGVAAVVVLAIYLYTPVPDGLYNDWRVQLRLLPRRMLLEATRISRILGKGSIFRHVEIIQKPIQTPIPPEAADHEDVKLTRVILSGVPVLVYQPVPATPNSPGLIHIHGGGFALCQTNDYYKTLLAYMRRTGAVVFSIEYSRAPQHKYPAAIDECLAATRHVLKHAGDYGADNTNIGIIGESAGGNLAAAVTLNLTRDKPRDLPGLKFQLLNVPMLQAVNFNLPGFLELEPYPIPLRAYEVAAFWALYMFGDASTVDEYAQTFVEHRHISPEVKAKYDRYVNPDKLPREYQRPRGTSPARGLVSSEPHNETIAALTEPFLGEPRLFPLLADDLSGQPPTLVHVADFDVLRDDGILYSQRLREQGVQVELIVNKGGTHFDFTHSSHEFLHPKTVWAEFNANVAYINRMFQRES